MKRLTLTTLLVLAVFSVFSQIIEPIKWTFDSRQDGRDVELIFEAAIEENWHLYDTYLPEGGPIATQLVFEDSTLFDFAGDLTKNPQPVEKFDNTFQMNLRFFSNEATLTQKIRLKSDEPVEISGYVLFMGCDDEMCLPPNEAEFSFKFNGSAPAKQDAPAVSESSPSGITSGSSSGQTLWLFILISALAGFAAILTPCVFPMIPMTVSFFMRGSENRGRAVRTGLFFGVSIVLIFSLLGALFTFGLFGPNVGNILSTHWIPNLIFFLLFLVFAVSFFGAFEIVLPSSLVNKTDSKAEKGGMIGAFFMALTTVIVSFSCTGPFIGALIIEAVQDGGMRPLIGMFFFGLAFAAPFTLLAIFPSALNKLPKSGGWLNSIKVVFAFVLLAFGLKFLSNIDQVYGLNFISREIYLAIWIVLFFLLGMYFLGKIKFSHDSDVPFIGTGRLFLSVATFTFVIYLFTGLFGAPLTSISALLPPPSQVHSFVGGGQSAVQNTQNELCGPAKYADKLHLPHGLNGYFDYEQGMACAEEQNKPVFLVFKGHACANCKKMENGVWADSRALKLLSEKYVIVALYTDDRTTLSEDEWITSKVDGKVKKTMGKKNLDFQIEKYETNSIPFHVVIEPDGTERKLGVTFDADEFVDFLEKRL
ncbi:Thiol:disulfide interchange protein DsbD [Mariniphaga anaerophila]|uniref:Thiol:disulfide interchange protein DsbD n=1 Tax=Mariniphaga anaerophila TaxID=1484053 RepID=A0A1M4W738_9BACT|nr:cytochrome c biogenesis protein CcdA [Mariniphaga anaerophila]SHE77078.1 Thiol:disulfide interchange protein DsbD [Mariniphaga anaerophila]